MKVLTAAEMRDVDRLTIERGIPGIVLMENAGARVVEFLARRFAPLSHRRIVVLCGKGNNGGDGLVIARQLFTRFRPKALDVVLVGDPAEMRGDAAASLRMLEACGCPYSRAIAPEMRHAGIVIDALLGTGLTGPATGAMLEAIREINTGFPLARVVAVDIPSGMPSDSPHPAGEFARADCTVTFTAPKIAHALAPNCNRMGELAVAPIGSPADLLVNSTLELIEPSGFAGLLAPRDRSGHKGDYGHALIIGGAPGKAGAAAMAGLAALRAGAGLVTVACSELNLMDVAPELMTAPLADARAALARKDVVAIGPGLGASPEAVELTRSLVASAELPLVIEPSPAPGEPDARCES
jgi:ADP-dependent NAD(P)H-hydrate dehydratase / NAD(P)H-hydrate epimerase